MRTPYGYMREGDDWTVDEAAAGVVRRIFNEFAAPYRHTGLSELAVDLNLDDVATAAGGRQWFPSTVRYLLRNKVYVGRRQGYPAIVDQEVWDRAQQRLAALPMGPTR